MPESLQRAWAAVSRTIHLDRLRQAIMPLLMLLSLGIVMVALFAWQLPYGSRLLLQADQIAPFTVVAPMQITFESQVLTDRARERAAQQVPEQHDVEEAAVRRQQVTVARDAIA